MSRSLKGPGQESGPEQMIRDIETDFVLTGGMISNARFSQPIRDAMRDVPRDRFVPESLRHQAYLNAPLPIGQQQTISQPYIVALMTALLEIEPQHRLLEIGTGSGYQCAVLSRLCRAVYSIERLHALQQSASARLQALHYTNITLKTGNGYEGWPELAPFDGIIVTAAAPEPPPRLVEQLKPGAHLVMPVGSGNFQQLVRITRHRDGSTEEEKLIAVAFVPLLDQDDNSAAPG